MISTILSFIYGVGFALTLVGGFIWLMVLNLFKGYLHPLKVLIIAIVWPIALPIIGYKIYKFIWMDDEYQGTDTTDIQGD
jgi:hypothetical protein